MTFWRFPWKYKQSLLFTLFLLCTGISIEVLSNGAGVNPPPFPFNAFLVVLLILIVLVLHAGSKNIAFVRWLSSVPAAISSILLFTFLILIMGFIPQKNELNNILRIIGFTHITSSWEYLISSMFMLVILGLTIAKRMLPLRLKNISFFLNHAGLWIVLVAGSIGASDMQRVQLYAFYGKPIHSGIDNSEKEVSFPFSMELLQFSIEDYLPEIVLVESKTGKIIQNNNAQKSIASRAVYTIKDYTIVVDTFYKEAFYNSNNFLPDTNPGNVPAAKISISNIKNKEKTGWICSQSFANAPMQLTINKDYFVALTIPQPKNFSSRIRVKSKNNKEEIINLVVNKPYKNSNWTIYQTGYDTEKGKWSQFSLIEAVKDSWLPFVYCGFFMVFAGATMLFWQGKRNE